MGCGKPSVTNQTITPNKIDQNEETSQTRNQAQNKNSPQKPIQQRNKNQSRVQFDQSSNKNYGSKQQNQTIGRQQENQEGDIFYKSFAETVIEKKEKQLKQKVVKEQFIYKEKDSQFKDTFLKAEPKQETKIIQKKQEEIPDQQYEILQSEGAHLTAGEIKESQQGTFLIQGRFKTKIHYAKYQLNLPPNKEQILINAINRIFTQFPFLVYQDLIVTQCGKEIPFVKCGGYLYNQKHPSFGIIINFGKNDPKNCDLKTLESQGFTSIELYEPQKPPKELTFSKLFTIQQKYLKQFNEMQGKLKAKSLNELLKNDQFQQLREIEKEYQNIQGQFENKCLQAINKILNNNELETALNLDQIYSNEFEQYIFDDDIVVIMFRTFYDGNLKQLKKICSITKLISMLPGNDKIFPPQLSIFKQFNNCYFVCYTLLPISRRDQIYGSDEQSLLINSSLDENLSANEMKALSEYWASLGNLFNFQELILFEKCSDHKRHCKLPLGTSIYKNKFEQDENLPKYFILNFTNFVYPINNSKQMAEYALLSETNFQLNDGIAYQNLKKLLPNNKNVQKKQINLIMDDYQKHKKEKQLIKEYFDNDLMSLSSSVMTENPSQSTNSLQIDINEQGLKLLFETQNFQLNYSSSLPAIIHLHGIGIKSLGNIFKFAPTQELKSLIVCETLARTFKNQFMNQIFEEEEIADKTNEQIIEIFQNQINNMINSFLTKQFTDEENVSFLQECKNLFSIELSYEELLTFQITAETVTQRVMQLILSKLSYCSQKIMLLRSSALNQLTKVIIAQYLGKDSSNPQNEIKENKNELITIIKNENF